MKSLTWSQHIDKLSLQLAKYGAMLYQIRDFVSQHTLNMLCYAFVSSTTTKSREMVIRLNNIVHTIIWNKRLSHVTHLYKKLELLK